MRVAIILVLLLTSVTSAVNASGSTDDCFTTGDAPADPSGSIALTLPSYCETVQHGGSGDEDHFTFYAEAGNQLYAATTQSQGGYIEIYAPGDSPDVDLPLGYVSSHGQKSFTIQETGWHLIWAIGGTHFALSVNETLLQGKALVGTRLPNNGIEYTHGPTPAAQLGTGIDGAWLTLPATSTGNEIVNADVSGWYDLWFHDAAGTEVGSCEPTAEGVEDEGVNCVAPTGATHFLATTHAGPVTGLTWRFWYHN